MFTVTLCNAPLRNMISQVSFNISSVSTFPPTPFSPPGPTHEGQPSSHSHSLTNSSARWINSSWISNNFWLKPIPAGTRSYRTTDGSPLAGFHAGSVSVPEVTRIAHQEERREVAKHETQTSKSAADADILLHFLVAGSAKRGEIFKAVGFFRSGMSERMRNGIL